MRRVNRARVLQARRAQHIAKETPVHSAQPTPPLVQGLPSALGSKNERPLPPHSSTMRKVLMREPALQLGERQAERPLHLPIDDEAPAFRICGWLGQQAVVANEETCNRRRFVVEQLLGRLGHQRQFAQRSETIFAVSLQERCGSSGH